MKIATFKVKNGTDAAKFIWRLMRTLEKLIAYNLPESLIIQSNGKEGRTIGFKLKPIISARVLAVPYTSGDEVLSVHKKVTFDSLGITLDLQKLCKNPDTAMVPVYRAFIKIWEDSKKNPEKVYNAGPQQPKRNPMGRPFTTCDVPGQLLIAHRSISEAEGKTLPKGKGTKVTKLTATDKRVAAWIKTI